MLLRLLWGKTPRYFNMCIVKLNGFGVGEFGFRLRGVWEAEMTLDGEPIAIYDRKNNILHFPLLGERLHMGATEPKDREFHSLLMLGGLGSVLMKRISDSPKRAHFYWTRFPPTYYPVWYLEISLPHWLLILPEPYFSTQPNTYEVLISPKNDCSNSSVIPYLTLAQNNIPQNLLALLSL